MAVEFGRIYKTIGFDVNEPRIKECTSGEDSTLEVSPDELKSATKLQFSSNPNDLSKADIIIVAVPTPINHSKQPNLSSLEKASSTVGCNMKKGVIVVYESTVYPGATEEICVPILEKESGMIWKKDFHVGYSPERINPGDKEKRLPNIKKVVSGDNKETGRILNEIYSSIIKAGTHLTNTIKEAEAAKVIENTQRDLNIALINELALIFDKMGIDTLNVLEASGTKWNFLPFRPGLVGGHCIGVDPYYLTYKAKTIGYNPEVILAGRRINDNMGKYVAEKAVKEMIHANKCVKGSKTAVLGLTFKENCPDLRNSRVIDIINELKEFGTSVYVHDPLADKEAAQKEYGINLMEWDDIKNMDAIIIATAHTQYKKVAIEEYKSKLAENGCIIDVKSILPTDEIKSHDIKFWRL